MITQPFCAGDISRAKVLVIGHDPRLQKTDTQAGYAFFADYFYHAIPLKKSERAKYQLAEAVFAYVGYLTSHQYAADQIVLTNLCNSALPHAPKGKIVYIPEEAATTGLAEIRSILERSSIEVIFAMSAQVNYWLQKLNFYPAVASYMTSAEPKLTGVNHTPPYYDPKQGRTFRLICGKRHTTTDGRMVYPILHVKNWPLKGAFVPAYAKAYEQCINELKPAGPT